MQEVLTFFFYFFFVDKALPCEGTDFWKNKLFSENRWCLVLLQIYPFSTQVQKPCLHFLPQFRIFMKFWKKLLSSINHLIKLFPCHFKLKELKWSYTSYSESFPPVTEKNRKQWGTIRPCIIYSFSVGRSSLSSFRCNEHSSICLQSHQLSIAVKISHLERDDK